MRLARSYIYSRYPGRARVAPLAAISLFRHAFDVLVCLREATTFWNNDLPHDMTTRLHFPYPRIQNRLWLLTTRGRSLENKADVSKLDGQVPELRLTARIRVGC